MGDSEKSEVSEGKREGERQEEKEKDGTRKTPEGTSCHRQHGDALSRQRNNL
jgi:hypothetical protein